MRGALPGEHVRATGRAGHALHVTEVLTPSPDRVEPPCRHFPACGGCTLQHLAPAVSLAWKTAIVADAVRDPANADPPSMRPAVAALPYRRRRMDLAYARDGRLVALGLNARGTSAVIDLTECHVLRPDLFALIAPLRERLGRLAFAGPAGSIVVNGLDTGADLLFRSARSPNAADRAALARLLDTTDIARISWQHAEPRRRTAPETLASRATPTHRFGATMVAPPPGAFLQATADGEAAIVGDLLEALAPLGRAPRVVELYAGVGTLTLPMAERGARVHAIEGDAAAIAALARAAGGLPITTTTRDLARAPMAVAELAGADAIVLDPPFRGAGVQIDTVAAAGAKLVVLVSCNPAALAREAAVLRATGYALTSARAIDQFAYSAHVESVAVFRRENSRRSRSGHARSDW